MRTRIILTVVALLLVGLVYEYESSNAPSAPPDGGGVVVQP